MKKSKHVTRDMTPYVLGSVMLVMFLAALIGVFGQTAQLIALCMAMFLAPIGVSLFIGASVWLLNRTCRYCHEALATENDVVARAPDPKTERLKATVDALRQEELSCAERYSRRRCSSDDLIRATSLRVQAEIELLREEAMPKSWAEACGKVRARTSFTN